MTAQPLCPLPWAGEDAPGTAPPLVLEFAARPLEVRRSLAAVTRHLAEAGIGAEPRGRVEIVLAEALNNIVEHAYRHRPEGRVCLALRSESGRARLQLCDRGAPMPAGQVPPPASAPAPGTLPEGGFGWTLIRSICARTAYRRQDGCNCLDLDIVLG